MRTAVKTKTFTVRLSDGHFRYEEGSSFASLCASQTREAFDLGRFKTVDFVVTNAKPKSLRGWHKLHLAYEGWTITTSPRTLWFMHRASKLLSKEFPKNVTLYACAYT